MNQLLTNSGTQATLSRKSSKEVPDDAIKRNKIIKAADESKLCLLGNFACFLSSADFFKINFFEKFFWEYHQSVKQFGSRSELAFCLT